MQRSYDKMTTKRDIILKFSQTDAKVPWDEKYGEEKIILKKNKTLREADAKSPQNTQISVEWT